ncbi:hypothetical protein KKA53_02680 [Candidatus Dependentiae bacterium]|nr:hypothetical protein [Candidatus Dependentiae bacterium]
MIRKITVNNEAYIMKSYAKIFLFLILVFPLSHVVCMGQDGEDLFLGDFFKSIGVDEMEEQNKHLDEVHRASLNPMQLDEVKLWMKTAGFRTRDSLFLIPQRKLSVDKPGLTGFLFYNLSNTLPVRPNLVLSQKAVNTLVELTKPGGILSGVNLQDLDGLLKVLPFIDKMTVQERKVGGMFQANIVDGRWVLQLETLLMLVERNFWAKCKGDRKALLDAIGDSGKGDAYRMRFGWGDTRVRFGYKITDSETVKAVTGVSLIIPTSRIGRKKPRSIVTSSVGDSRKKLIDDLLNMNKQLMIEPKLGSGHWGIGWFWDTRLHVIPNKLDFWGRISFDYLLPANEYRYMPSTKPISLGLLGQLTTAETVPDGFPISDLFPCLARGRVTPGGIFNATFGFDWKLNTCWKLGVGYDFYSQQAERIKNISAPNIDSSLLSVDDAIASKIIQHKLFGGLYYTKRGKALDWNFGIGGDTTFSTHGGPRDWTVFAKLGITF